MWTDETTTRAFRIDDGSLVDWARISAALDSAISGCLEYGNLRVVAQTITVVFGDVDTVRTYDGGWVNREYICDAWQRVIGGVASPGDCDALWSLFFKAYSVTK